MFVGVTQAFNSAEAIVGHKSALETSVEGLKHACLEMHGAKGGIELSLKRLIPNMAMGFQSTPLPMF